MKATTTTRFNQCGQFVAALARRGIRVRADGDRVVVWAAKGVITPAIRKTLKQRRDDLLDFVQGGPAYRAAEIRDRLAEQFAGHADLERILARFDTRRLVSLPAQFEHISEDDGAWQAAWEMGVIFGPSLSPLPSRPSNVGAPL